MRTLTAFISFDKLAKADGANEVIRVAMVCNDLAIANSSMGHYKNIGAGSLNHIRRGGLLYFVRMSCGHLNEGIETLEDIRRLPQLLDVIGRCSVKAQSAFHELCECLRGGKDNNRFREYVGWIRNRVGFHYSTGDVHWALDATKQSRSLSLTGGEDIHSTRFEFGDDLLDAIVCRRFWHIGADTDLRLEADRIADWCFTKSICYLQFGADFVTRFLREHNVLV